MRTTRGWGQPLLRWLAALAAVLTAAALVRTVLRDLDAVRVEGGSMRPSLQPGDLVLVEAWTLRRRPPRTGDVVLAGDPRAPLRELVKRVAAVDLHHGTLRLAGDDPAHSTDSRTFGELPLGSVRWRVLVRYWPLRPRR